MAERRALAVSPSTDVMAMRGASTRLGAVVASFLVQAAIVIAATARPVAARRRLREGVVRFIGG